MIAMSTMHCYTFLATAMVFACDLARANVFPVGNCLANFFNKFILQFTICFFISRIVSRKSSFFLLVTINFHVFSPIYLVYVLHLMFLPFH